ncbi:hypothetical protein BDD12DRAFT_496327 [Trichophaea hybrida]|nr:hypothetical protein BDD12DRAFT_496327 [Trichophaea hybrida]
MGVANGSRHVERSSFPPFPFCLLLYNVPSSPVCSSKPLYCTKPWTAFNPSPRQLHSIQSTCSAAPASVSKNLTGQQQSKSPSSPNRIILAHPLPHLAPAGIIPPMQPEIHTSNPVQERSEVSQTTTITINAAKKRTRGDSGVIDGKSGRRNGDLTNCMYREVSTIWAHRKLIGFFWEREGRGGKGVMVEGGGERSMWRGKVFLERDSGGLRISFFLEGREGGRAVGMTLWCLDEMLWYHITTRV